MSRSRRLSVSLSPAEFAIVERLAAANGESMSALVSSLVSSVAPALERVAAVVEAAEAAREAAQGTVQEQLAQTAAEVEAVVMPAMQDAMQSWATGVDALEQAAREAAGDPRSSNTGVR